MKQAGSWNVQVVDSLLELKICPMQQLSTHDKKRKSCWKILGAWLA